MNAVSCDVDNFPFVRCFSDVSKYRKSHLIKCHRKITESIRQMKRVFKQKFASEKNGMIFYFK